MSWLIITMHEVPMHKTWIKRWWTVEQKMKWSASTSWETRHDYNHSKQLMTDPQTNTFSKMFLCIGLNFLLPGSMHTRFIYKLHRLYIYVCDCNLSDIEEMYQLILLTYQDLYIRHRNENQRNGYSQSKCKPIGHHVDGWACPDNSLDSIFLDTGPCEKADAFLVYATSRTIPQ